METLILVFPLVQISSSSFCTKIIEYEISKLFEILIDMFEFFLYGILLASQNFYSMVLKQFSSSSRLMLRFGLEENF